MGIFVYYMLKKGKKSIIYNYRNKYRVFQKDCLVGQFGTMSYRSISRLHKEIDIPGLFENHLKMFSGTSKSHSSSWNQLIVLYNLGLNCPMGQSFWNTRYLRFLLICECLMRITQKRPIAGFSFFRLFASYYLTHVFCRHTQWTLKVNKGK